MPAFAIVGSFAALPAGIEVSGIALPSLSHGFSLATESLGGIIL